MPTDDQQIFVTGQASAPATFTIPGNGQITPRSIFATFDGSGAGSSFLPALKIISDGGETVGIYPTDQAVAGGGSADVSWFPGVKQQAAAAAGSGLPWAYLSGQDVTIATTGGTNLTGDHTSFYTSDATVFDVHQNAGLGNIYGIRFLAQGHYHIFGNFTPTTAPPAAAVYELQEASVGGADADYFGGFKQVVIGASPLTDEGDLDLHLLQSASVADSGLPTLPLVFRILTSGTSSATFKGTMQVIVVQRDTDGTLLV